MKNKLGALLLGVLLAPLGVAHAADQVISHPAATAQRAPSPPASGQITELPEVDVRGRAEDLLGVATTASEGAIGSVDLKDLPLLRRGELLENRSSARLT